MAKFAMLAAVLATIVIAQGFPASDTEISDAASKGNWDLVHKLIRQQFNDQSIWDSNFSSGSVRSLKPSPGGQVYGTSEYSFRSSSDIDGQKSETSGGHRIINNNGKVEEYDFKP